MSVRKLERSGALALGALLIALLVLTMFSEGESTPTPRSVQSTEPDGRRALFLLLVELGFAPEAWNSTPEGLPEGRHVLWMPSAPDGADDEVFSAPEHYRRFLERGGTIVISATPDNVRFLVEELEQSSCDGLAFGDSPYSGEEAPAEPDTDVGEPAEAPIVVEETEDDETPADVHVKTRDGETWGARWVPGRSWWLDELELEILDLWTIEIRGQHRAIAASVPAGEGSIVLLADDAFLDNQHLAQADHAVLAERLAETVRGGGRILFDEYALGLWQPRSAIGLATSRKLLPLTANIALLFLLIAWRRVWTGRFPRDPEPIAALSPLSRARALAAVYERAGRVRLLSNLLREGVLRRAKSRLHMRADAPIEALVQRRAGIDAARFERAFGPRSVRTVHELDELGRELARLESDLDESAHLSAPPAKSTT